MNYVESILGFWTYNIANPSSPEEKACEELFLQANNNRRFIIKLSTRQDKLNSLEESRNFALRRFISSEKRLSVQPCMYAEYRKFTQEYIHLDDMRKINIHIILAQLLHPFISHIILYEMKRAPFRVVFDSCKTMTELSLNDAWDLRYKKIFFPFWPDFEYLKLLIDDTAKMFWHVLVDSIQTSTYFLVRISW